MNEQDSLKGQLALLMIYNLIAFATIFIIFGIIVSFLFKNSIYSSLDTELENTANLYLQEDQLSESLPSYFLKDKYLDLNIDYNGLELFRDYILSRKVKDPKYTVLIRDNDLQILNINDLGVYYEEYGNLIPFEKNNLGNVYTLNFGTNYYYRGINIKLDNEDKENIRYIQILINADSEILLIKSFNKVIISSILVGILLSIIASYFLSKRTLIPIEETIEKQTEFVQNASHELRTPLTIIQAKQELLLREPNKKIIDKSEDIVLTLNETKRLAKLTKDLMLLASVYNNKMPLTKEEVDLDELVEATVAPYIEVANLAEKELSLNLNYKKLANVDVSKIQQLIIILLDNALKYTETGDKIEITTSLKDGKCTIEVKDTGIGISDKGIKEIFNRFYREDEARNRETGGSGLGLSIADTIVKAHGGTIKAMHNNPKGTIFVIKLSKV